VDIQLQMRLIVAIVLVLAAVAFSDPARPNLHETFESHSTAWLKRGTTSIHGSGRWAVDQPHGVGVEHIQWANGSEHHNIHVIHRYDKATQFEVQRDHQTHVQSCHKTPLAPPMQTVWAWVKDAQYKGHVTIRRQNVDYWEYAAGAGVTLGVGVNLTNPDQPIWYIRKTSSESFELHFEHYAHRQANSSWFDVPKVCQTAEDDWIEKTPALPISVPSQGPNGIAQVLDKARSISTCGCPYVWGGNGPCCPGKSGYDCSGMTHAAYANGGYSIPRVAADQQKHGHACSGAHQAGDLLFFGTPAHHVVMYAGNNMIYECPHTGANCHHVAMRSYDGGCRRIV
jgi:hypothetical protein